MKNIDFVDLDAVFRNEGNVSIAGGEWHFEALATGLRTMLEEHVRDPSTWEGTASRLLILMQWSNILNVSTNGGNPESYFGAEDFERVMDSDPDPDPMRLTPARVNTHLNWVEKRWTERFSAHCPRGPELKRTLRLPG